MLEFFSQPGVVRLDKADHDAEDDHSYEENAGAVVAAAFHYGVHFLITIIVDDNYLILLTLSFKLIKYEKRT